MTWPDVCSGGGGPRYGEGTVIDDLTIAATGGFESSSIGRRTGDGAAAARLSSVFGDLLHGYASFSAGEPIAVSALVEPGDEPRTPDDADR